MHVVSLTGAHAHAAIENELPPSDRSGGIGRGRFGQACRQFLDGATHPGRLKRMTDSSRRLAAISHGAEGTHLLIRAGLERDCLVIREVDEDFETLAGRNPQLRHCDRRPRVNRRRTR